MSKQPKSVVPPVAITIPQFPSLIRGVKAFLRQEEIDKAVQALTKLESDGNPFRSMLLGEKPSKGDGGN